MTSSHSSTAVTRKRNNSHTIHIRINPNLQKLDLKDPKFIKLLQHEYATRYLQGLGVEATVKNINRVLKQNPLQECEIVQSRMNGGLHTDTITIITRKNEQSSKNRDTPGVTSEMLQILNLKRMNIVKHEQDVKASSNQINPINILHPPSEAQTSLASQTSDLLSILSFSISSIKSIYIFPFNSTFKRTSNYRLKDTVSLLDADEESGGLALLASRIFQFPFTQVKLGLKVLKEMQMPIGARLSDIAGFVQKWIQLFPKEVIPVSVPQKKINSNTAQSKNYKVFAPSMSSSTKPHQSSSNKNISLSFSSHDIELVFTLLKSDQNIKFIGVFLHLAYWAIFGTVNPIQVDLQMREKMYVMLFETLQYFQIRIQNQRLWTCLGMPMVLLCLKMAARYFFTLGYSKLFQSQDCIKCQANEIAFDKILLLVEKLFDQGNINGRFIFLESDIDGEKGNFIKDKKYIRKRIFGTSPALNLILPMPSDGRARAIMAKNLQIDQQDGVIEASWKKFKLTQDSDQLKQKQKTQDQGRMEGRRKLLNLALHKINNRLEEKGGRDNNIINLKPQ